MYFFYPLHLTLVGVFGILNYRFGLDLFVLGVHRENVLISLKSEYTILSF